MGEEYAFDFAETNHKVSGLLHALLAASLETIPSLGFSAFKRHGLTRIRQISEILNFSNYI